ncbi:MAG TPA: glycosyltransferase family A protein [Candidatus Binataceae bacterium]|nr:glycosyltransferase family A protein [Candidatus Binataceae bacterium]
MKKYIAITPARDEERLLPGLLSAMVAQTRRPERWIIIDDGSTDRSGEIVDRAARHHPWITPQHLPRNGARAPGGESVIMRFLPRAAWEGYDAILRLDADLTFQPQFAELLLAELEKDPRLGIAGPTLYEARGGRWHEIPAPSFHTRGAAKFYTSACFAAIGGLEAGLGWDTIDEVRAMMLGFRTRSFRHVCAYHHRPQGAAGGNWRGRKAAGRAAYNVGYSPLFLAARALRLGVDWPPLINGLGLMAGYLEGAMRRSPRPVSPAVIKFVRRQQLRRLLLRESVWR